MALIAVSGHAGCRFEEVARLEAQPPAQPEGRRILAEDRLNRRQVVPDAREMRMLERHLDRQRALSAANIREGFVLAAPQRPK